MTRVTPTILLVLILVSGALADDPAIQDGDRVHTDLATTDGPRGLELPAAAGTDLRIRIRGEGALVLLDPDGRPLEVSTPDRPGRATLARDALPVTGVYRLLLSGDGPVRLKVRARAPKTLRFTGEVGPGESARLEFGAVAGSRLDVKLKGSDGLRPDVPSAQVPGDGDVPLRARLTGPRVSVRGIHVPGLGDGTILVTSRTEEGGRYQGKIRLHAPRERRAVTLPELRIDERHPGGDLLVLGAHEGRLDDETFPLRVRAAHVRLVHGRGPSGEARDRVGVVIELESRTGGLLAWVLLRLWRPEDLAPGTWSLRDDRIEMLHVVTNYRGLLYSTAVAGISGPRSGAMTLRRARAEAGAEVEGVLDGEVERARDGRRIVLENLPIEAVVRESSTRAVL